MNFFSYILQLFALEYECYQRGDDDRKNFQYFLLSSFTSRAGWYRSHLYHPVLLCFINPVRKISWEWALKGRFFGKGHRVQRDGARVGGQGTTYSLSPGRVPPTPCPPVECRFIRRLPIYRGVLVEERIYPARHVVPLWNDTCLRCLHWGHLSPLSPLSPCSKNLPVKAGSGAVNAAQSKLSWYDTKR